MIRRLLALAGLVSVGAGVLLVLSTCGSQYALLLTIRAQESSSPPNVFDLRVKNVATGEVVLERVGEKVDADDPNRDISKKGQELKVAVEFADSGNYLVYIWARSGQGIEGSQFFVRDYQVDDVLEKDVLLVPLVEDSDGDGFPVCGASGVQCGPINCKYLDCDDSDRNIHPFATEVCENGKDDDCSAGCGAAPGDGDIKCVDGDGDGVPAGEDCDDNDPCRSPKIKEGKNLCKTTAADWDNEHTKACKDKLAKDGKQFVPPFCGDGIDQDCNGKDVACFTDKDCDDYTPPQDCNDDDPTINPQAAETCDGKDNNCNGVVDEGCVPCDVDGDKHADPNHTGGVCNLPKDDDDDYDSGIHPETTKADNGKEGGTVLGALRGYCGTALEKNGKLRNRDVDHDGDGQPASADGCPSETCDQDGDGFQNASCSPPKSQEDCNDNDAKVFPGAPDLCGDGVAQDCVADAPCTCDGDGDKYCSPADCDDKNPNVHPWALEKCDGLDNDCDSLVDEGNPDHTGTLIPTDSDRTIKCNNDPDGKCAPEIGICACSKIKTDDKKYNNNYALDPNRKMCPGESFTVASSPRCFGATSPVQEKCDNDDWNCNGNDFAPSDANSDPKLNDYEDYGKTCGTSVGQCKSAGIVTGCNLSQTLDPKILTVLGSGYNQHWICTLPGSSQLVTLPVAEKCNGFDDDCDGVGTVQDVSGTDKGWPELNEKDADGDHFMACSGCAGEPLASGLSGCDDCKDGVPGVYPTAFEACDNNDNNCKSGDEGTDQCKPPVTCCATQMNCRNLNTDFQNCGSCGKVCPSNTTDTCAGGNCVCGTSSGPCTGSRNCDNGSCKCLQGGLCTGCCASNTCQPGNTTTYCGTGGENCSACTTTNPCLTPVCNSSGSCGTVNKSNGTNCPGGKCYGGSCCTGCWDGSTCQGGTTNQYCGTGGVSCSGCNTTNPCRTANCSSGSCSITNNANGSSCPGGQCYGGSCCTGCWDGSTCQGGKTNTYCGLGGVDCTPCATANPCKTATCLTGTCLIPDKSDGTTCSGGKCYDGSCCTGCWDTNTSTCQAPSNDSHCGTGGVSCVVCTSTQDCVSGSCQCTSGSCGSGCCANATTCVTPPTDSQCGTGGASCVACTSGQDCVGGSCVCNSSSCPGGCCGAGDTCYSPPNNSHCGTSGASCIACTGDTHCTGGGCVCDSTTCPTGCCTGTGNGATCAAGTTDSQCGTSGGQCIDCTTNNKVCQGGSCVPKPTPDAGVTPDA